MAGSRATTVAQYLRDLPDDRRKIVAAMRRHILSHLPHGYEEAMNWGMIAYQVPLKRFPGTYNGQPLMYAALAAQKNYLAVHLMSLYQDPVEQKTLAEAFKKIGKKMDIGKSCLRFRALDDVPLDALGRVIARVSVDDFIRYYESVRRR